MKIAEYRRHLLKAIGPYKTAGLWPRPTQEAYCCQCLSTTSLNLTMYMVCNISIDPQHVPGRLGTGEIGSRRGVEAPGGLDM